MNDVPALAARTILTTIVCGILGASIACFLTSEEVRFTFDNRTGSLLCVYANPGDASADRCLNDVEPQDHDRDWIVGCGDGPHADNARIWVILTDGPGGREIYNRTEECRVWQDSDRSFTIEKSGDEMFVTDPLP